MSKKRVNTMSVIIVAVVFEILTYITGLIVDTWIHVYLLGGNDSGMNIIGVGNCGLYYCEITSIGSDYTSVKKIEASIDYITLIPVCVALFVALIKFITTILSIRARKVYNIVSFILFLCSGILSFITVVINSSLGDSIGTSTISIIYSGPIVYLFIIVAAINFGISAYYSSAVFKNVIKKDEDSAILLEEREL